ATGFRYRLSRPLLLPSWRGVAGIRPFVATLPLYNTSCAPGATFLHRAGTFFKVFRCTLASLPLCLPEILEFIEDAMTESVAIALRKNTGDGGVAFAQKFLVAVLPFLG